VPNTLRREYEFPSKYPLGGSKRSNEISNIDINGFWKYLGRIRTGRTAVNR